MEFKEPVEEKELCSDCNVLLIHADYSDDPDLLYCPICTDEFI